MHVDSANVTKAKRYLGNGAFGFLELRALWKDLKEELEFGYARQVLARLADNKGILPTDDGRPDGADFDEVHRQLALCTSKDPDLSDAEQHDDALDLLRRTCRLDDRKKPTRDPEVLGIAGGIMKRKWEAFGQVADLKSALRYYERGYDDPDDEDFGYTAVNTAYLYDLLAALGEESEGHERARAIRKQVCTRLPALLDAVGDDGKKTYAWLENAWWYHATLAEACLGLGNTEDAIQAVQDGLAHSKVPYWEFETTARQFIALARLLPQTDDADVAAVVQALLAGAGGTPDVEGLLIGKVGLALSGGGFRASLYHLGVLARLAELDVLRHVEVLSCVSGGSIIGAMYYLALRRLLMGKEDAEITQQDYVDLVQQLADDFMDGGGLRDPEPGKLKSLWRVLTKQGAMVTEDLAVNVEQRFYSRYATEGSGLGKDGIWLDELNFEPPGHDPDVLNQGPFNPRRHNWRRTHKVPALVLNATTMNTGHCWQFTTQSMGETPYSIHEEVDGVARFRRAWYRRPEAGEGGDGRRMRLGRAVMASACVPALFQPLKLDGLYAGADGKQIDLRLVDGGVYDNQGSVSLLAHDCNVLIISDAAGQLVEDHEPNEGFVKGIGALAGRAATVLMERIRQAGYANLKSRLQSKLLRGLMFIHMKEGLNSEPISWVDCEDTYQPPERALYTDSLIRREFVKCLAELRTDLDDFSKEAPYLMAGGYQMARKRFERTLAGIDGLSRAEVPGAWEFADELDLIMSGPEERKQDREAAHRMLVEGKQVRLD